MSAETILSGIVETATLGKFGVAKNQIFTEEWEKVLAEKRNLATKIYDAGTLLLIDDENHRLVPRFVFIRKK